MVLHENAELFLGLNYSEDRVGLNGLKRGFQCVSKMLLGGREKCGHG